MKFTELNKPVSEEKVRLDPKCWKDKKIGNPKTKVKGGVRVNNCVPAESVNEDIPPAGYGDYSKGATNPDGTASAQRQADREFDRREYERKEKERKEKQRQNSSVAEDKKVSSHSELAKSAHDAYIQATRQGNALMANHYKQAYEKHKRLAASERKSAAKGMDEDANPNFVWIQGDFDGDTAVSGPEQGSWRDQTTKQVELIRGRLSNVQRVDGPQPSGGKTIKQARIPLTLDAGGGRQFSTTGVDLELTVAPNGYITKGDYGRVRGTAVVKIMRPGANESMAEDFNPEYDDEAGMADNNLQTLERAVQGIDELIDAGDNLPEWCQEKIANAKSMLVAVWDYMRSEEDRNEDPEDVAMYEAMDQLARVMAAKNNTTVDLVWEAFEQLSDHVLYETAQYQLSQLNEDWQKVNKRDKTDGMSRKAVKAYRRENPGSKLKTAVTTKPSKLKKGSKAAKRRKSFCSRMRGMKKARASAKTRRDPNSPINKALRRWNC